MEEGHHRREEDRARSALTRTPPPPHTRTPQAMPGGGTWERMHGAGLVSKQDLPAGWVEEFSRTKLQVTSRANKYEDDEHMAANFHSTHGY